MGGNRDDTGRRVYTPAQQDKRDVEALERRAAHLAERLKECPEDSAAGYMRRELGAIIRLVQRVKALQ